MDDYSANAGSVDRWSPPAEEQSAFGFHGTWREFAPIAFTNLLLIVVTLGIYRFWAKARERQYLWSRTRFIDERLEWTGTGKELFVGGLLVLALFLIPYFIATQVGQAMILRGEKVIGAILFVVPLVAIFYLMGVARFRAIRYRLGRTNWRGIRGGSDVRGFKYGWSYMWKTIAGYAAFGLGVPWSMVSLWNERWRAMSFGPMEFRCSADFSPLMKRYMLFYLSPFIAIVGIVAIIAAMAFGLQRDGGFDPENPSIGFFAAFIVASLLFYFVLGFVWLAYYAKFFRVVVGHMELGGLEFEFDAKTWDWIKLGLGDVALLVLTLGLGFVFLGYRHWKFFVTHMQAYGEINVDDLTQSTTRRDKHGEGLLDAFDMGAI
ncbi:YjgN family protein [Croceicoccus bisphenolivorans]|uniref:YjgN family protein n=1 Tax=Croceicoccus bisphenolivorans TaxID=1783232 RepID=UPI000836E9EF|nr:YjgN family protein [Croceicoccus bisphenolivorans]